MGINSRARRLRRGSPCNYSAPGLRRRAGDPPIVSGPAAAAKIWKCGTIDPGSRRQGHTVSSSLNILEFSHDLTRNCPRAPPPRNSARTTLVWREEYSDAHPAGYGHSCFRELYREFGRRLSPTMRLEVPMRGWALIQSKIFRKDQCGHLCVPEFLSRTFRAGRG